MDSLTAVVLAAGKGTRMRSETPKVLFPVAGKPMLQHIVDTLREAGVTDIYIVVGHGSNLVQETITGAVTWVEQREQLGTGHALAQATPHLSDYPGDLLVLFGDTPLLTADTIKGLVAEHQESKNAATVLTAQVPDPTGYGRIIRGNNCVMAITEEKDANQIEKTIDEINSGTLCFNWPRVGLLLDKLSKNNAQGEYYLTDIFSLLVLHGEKTGAYKVLDHREVAGVNDRAQLAEAEKVLRLRKARSLMLAGVTIADPDTVWVDAQVEVGQDTVILPNTHLYGNTRVGSSCILGPNTTLQACVVDDGVRIQYSVAEQAQIHENSKVGPFSYLRPGSQIGSGVKIGDFVEIKNSIIGDGTKVPHLSYVGDAKVGKNSNIGCGTITANYDGKNKNLTTIGNDVFIGSNSNLIAPVTVADGAYVAAGSTITDDVPARALAIARSRQIVKAEWRKKD